MSSISKKSCHPESGSVRADESFVFECGTGLECFNKCCRDINLYLTPYDILRIRKKLAIPSYEFLKTYTFPLFSEEVGHPVVLLKMLPDEMKNCPFVSDDGCMIYDDRPWSCRSFPLGPGTGTDSQCFEIVRRDFCLGFGKGKTWTISKWRHSQNVSFYEEINGEWRKVTHHPNFLTLNLLEGSPRDIFFLGSYNLDEFRHVVFHGDFLKYFDVNPKELKRLRANDTELLKFAFKWMRHVLFGENLLKTRRHRAIT